MNGLDELMQQLQSAGKLDQIAPKMIDESTPILEESLKAAVQQETDKGYATGELVSSIQKSKARMNQYGYFGVVRPRGKDKNGVRNMEKLAYLHYGTTKQAARPVVNKAVLKVKEKIIDKMQSVYERETGL